MAREPSLQELLVSSFENQTEGIFTAIPAVVLTVRDNLQQLSIDAQPNINQLRRDGTVMEYPPVLNVPVIMPASKTSAFLFPINVGDTVLLVFSMRGLDVFKRSGGSPTTPSDLRRFDMRDAVAIPGLFPFGNSVMSPSKHIWPHNPKDTVMVANLGTANETEVRLKQEGGLIINTYSKAEINCAEAVLTATDSVSLSTPQMNVNAENTNWVGTFVLDGITMNTHRHTGVQTGSGTSGTPTN